jgi:hypothetical protein
MSDYVEFRIRPKVPSQRGHKVLDGNQYDVWIRWNGTTEKWYMDLTQVSDSSTSMKGIALLQGRDLLGPHGYSNILGELWVEDTAGTYEDPTYEGMGDRWRLRYYPITS